MSVLYTSVIQAKDFALAFTAIVNTFLTYFFVHFVNLLTIPSFHG